MVAVFHPTRTADWVGWVERCVSTPPPPTIEGGM